MILQTEIILYVANQELSTGFYTALLHKKPSLLVPGMTEFQISEGLKLGLMPNENIQKIIELATLQKQTKRVIPRAELYFLVDNLDFEIKNALQIGAKIVSNPQNRDWGDRTVYLLDPDGYIIAFAEKILI